MSEPLSEEEVKELVELDKAANPGPWRTSPYVPHAVFVDTDEGPRHVTVGGLQSIGTAKDAKLIAAMRNALPRLLAEREELVKRVGVLEDIAYTAREVASLAAYGEDGADIDDCDPLIERVNETLGDGDDWNASQKCSDDPCERCGEGGIRHVRKLGYAKYEGLCNGCNSLDEAIEGASNVL